MEDFEFGVMSDYDSDSDESIEDLDGDENVSNKPRNRKEWTLMCDYENDK
jgi:hypothetical protein